MMRKSALSFVICLFICLFPSEARAQSLSLDPQTATKGVGEEFTVNINMDTAGKAVAGVDIKITFDAAMLEVKNIATGDFFSDEAHNIGAGSFYIAGYFREQFATKTGSGTIATLTLKGKSVGATPLTFVCTAQTNDTNILDASANDIIDCAGTKSGTYTFTGGAQPTAVPTTTSPTTVPAGTQTATPTPPVSGISFPTVFSLGTGALLAVIGLVLAF